MADPNTRNQLLAAFDSAAADFSELARSVGSLVERLLSSADIHVHSVTYRSKSRASFEAKVSRPDKEYRELSEITDLAGIRITTYFAADVDRVASLVLREFLVDAENSVDKRQQDADRFGYASLHYVASLSKSRRRLAEYRRFASRKFEVQIRSILQHAWAEIEHDLGYKSTRAVPQTARRRFARLAGLLELADDEFAAIRTELRTYERTIGERIANSAQAVELNKPSLLEFVLNDSSMAAMDEAIAASTGATLKAPDPERFEHHLRKLEAVGLSTIQQLRLALAKERTIAAAFARAWTKERPLSVVNRGIGLLYLCYVLVGRKESVEDAREFFERTAIGTPPEREGAASKVVRIYGEVTAAAPVSRTTR